MKLVVVTLTVALLAACGAVPTEGNAQAESFATVLRPGIWHTQAEVLGLAPGVPAHNYFEGKDTENKNHVIDVAVAAAPGPEAFLGSLVSTCEKETWSVAKGSISGTLRCSGEGSFGPSTANVTGSFTRTSFEARSEQTVAGITIQSTVRGKHDRDS